MNKTFSIYYLADETMTPFYVGRTETSLEARLSGHLNHARHGRPDDRSTKIRDMLAKNVRPTINLIATIEGDVVAADEAERLWIDAFVKAGAVLTNGTDGGIHFTASEQTKQRMRDSQLKLKRKMTDEHKEKLRAANIGRKMSEENKQKLREANRGRKMTEENKQKLLAANLGRKHSEETKQKMRGVRGKYRPRANKTETQKL